MKESGEGAGGVWESCKTGLTSGKKEGRKGRLDRKSLRLLWSSKNIFCKTSGGSLSQSYLSDDSH